MSRDLPPADSEFVAAMKEAMSQYLKMRAEGVSKDDAVAGLKLMLMEKFARKQQRDRRAEAAGRDTWDGTE